MKSFKIFCLQSEINNSQQNKKSILPSLENFTLQHSITTVYKTYNTFEDFEECLNNLIYEDKNFKDYKVIYIITEGSDNELIIDDYKYSFNEIAEIFEGKLTDKILHFSNLTHLNLEEDTAQYFLDVTGAKAISGYSNETAIFSAILDFEYFLLCERFENAIIATKEIYNKNYALAKTLGFTCYY